MSGSWCRSARHLAAGKNKRRFLLLCSDSTAKCVKRIRKESMILLGLEPKHQHFIDASVPHYALIATDNCCTLLPQHSLGLLQKQPPISLLAQQGPLTTGSIFNHHCFFFSDDDDLNLKGTQRRCNDTPTQQFQNNLSN